MEYNSELHAQPQPPNSFIVFFIMEMIRCDLCGSDDYETLYQAEDLIKASPQSLDVNIKLVRCKQCSLMYLNPRPSSAEIGQYYPEDYMSYHRAVEDEPMPLMRWMRSRNLARRRKYIEKYSRIRTGRLVDVGSSTGLFLNDMVKAGWDVKGIEPVEYAVDYARNRFGLDIFQGYLQEAGFEPGSFDVITFWDVLEHTFSPTSELKHAAALLRPEGLLAINIPNWDSPDRRLFGIHWIGLDPPRHFYIFTKTTILQFLKKTGFQYISSVCLMPSYYSFIISLENWLNAQSPGLARKIGRLLKVPGMRFLFQPYFTIANRLKRGGVVTIFARKVISEAKIERS